MNISSIKESDELNKGFTIVELVIVIAILSIVGLILGTLITTGVNLYQRQNKDLNLQTRSQLLQSQITTYITNADLGIYAPATGDSSFFPSGSVTTIFATLSLNEDYYADKSNDELYADFESGLIHARAGIIAFSEENSSVYYFTGFNGSADGLPVTVTFVNGIVTLVTADESSIVSEDITTWPVLSDYVNGFEIDYTSGDSVVNVKMELEYSGRTYDYDFSIAIRNDTSLYGPGVSTSELEEGTE